MNDILNKLVKAKKDVIVTLKKQYPALINDFKNLFKIISGKIKKAIRGFFTVATVLQESLFSGVKSILTFFGKIFVGIASAFGVLVRKIRRFPFDLAIALKYALIAFIVENSIRGIFSGIKEKLQNTYTKNKLGAFLKNQKAITLVTAVIIKPLLKETLRNMFLEHKDVQNSSLFTMALLFLDIATSRAISKITYSPTKVSPAIVNIVSHILQIKYKQNSTGYFLAVLLQSFYNAIDVYFIQSGKFNEFRSSSAGTALVKV